MKVLFPRTRVDSANLPYISLRNRPALTRTHLFPSIAALPGLRLPISISMATLEPLAMSQTKDDLLKHLNMRPETYTLMAVRRALS